MTLVIYGSNKSSTGSETNVRFALGSEVGTYVFYVNFRWQKIITFILGSETALYMTRIVERKRKKTNDQ